MKKLLLVGLLLAGLSGCSKGGSDPAPAQKPTATLQARWLVDSTWVNNTPTATKSNIQVLPAGVGLEFTVTEYLVLVGNTVDKRGTYTLTNNVVTLSGGSSISNIRTITQLTPSRLVMQHIPDGLAATSVVRATTTYHR